MFLFDALISSCAQIIMFHLNIDKVSVPKLKYLDIEG